MTPQPPLTRRALAVHAAGVACALLPIVAGVTTAYAASPASASAVGAPGIGNAPVAAPSCLPWQTATTVPPGVTLTPRVFPPSPAPPSASASPTTSPRSTSPAP